MRGDVNNAIIGYVAAPQIVFTGIQVDPKVGLTAIRFRYFPNLFRFDTSANQSCQSQSARRCWFTSHVVNRALESKSQTARLSACRHCALAFHARIVGIENRIGHHQQILSGRFVAGLTNRGHD